MPVSEQIDMPKPFYVRRARFLNASFQPYNAYLQNRMGIVFSTARFEGFLHFHHQFAACMQLSSFIYAEKGGINALWTPAMHFWNICNFS